VTPRKPAPPAVSPLLHCLRAARDLSACLSTDEFAACLEASDLALIATLHHFLDEAAHKASPSSQPWSAEEGEPMLIEPVRMEGRPTA
jgi:hypothetical protein